MPNIPPILPFEDEHIHEAPERGSKTIDPARNPGIKVEVVDPITPPVVVTDAKSPALSKMNLFNALVFILGVLEFFGQVSVLGLFIADEALRQRVAAVLLTVVVPLINMVLRSFFTYRPTTLAVVPGGPGTRASRDD